MGFASVSIYFDNADRRLNMPYDEVVESRRVYRSGESEYKINGAACRLRDIEELFYELSCQLGKEFEMKQKRVWKNNGVSYEGLVIEKLEEELSQVVSLDNCYEDFRAGISVQEISE